MCNFEIIDQLANNVFLKLKIFQKMNKENLIKYKVIIIASVFVIVAFLAGIFIGEGNFSFSGKTLSVKNSSNASSTINLDEFWTVWSLLDQKFVATKKDAKSVSNEDKVYAAIQGLASAYGDPYTIFMPPTETSNFESSISGNFEGVGMELAFKDGNLVVVAPLKDTPAYKAGVKKGDIVSEIDGTSTLNMSVDDAVKSIRGTAGTNVKITFLREGVADPIKLTITRGIIDVPTIDTEIVNDVFIIRLYSFNAISAEKFKSALREFVQSNKSKLILDLRGNPGGYLESAVDMASWFLPLGKVVVRESFGSTTEEIVYRSKGYNIFTDKLKMVILADSGSASASEILAGALKEQGIAKLVGTKTFGKGSVQELIKVSSKTSLKVTIARWLTPNGTSISDGGLSPDYEVQLKDEDVEVGKDTQQEKAIEILNQM